MPKTFSVYCMSHGDDLGEIFRGKFGAIETDETKKYNNFRLMVVDIIREGGTARKATPENPSISQEGGIIEQVGTTYARNETAKNTIVATGLSEEDMNQYLVQNVIIMSLKTEK